MRNRSNNLKCCADTSFLSPSDRFNVLGMKPLHIGLVLAVFLSLLVTCFHMTLLTDSLAHQSALDELHEKFQRCLAVNAVGLTATQLDVCRVQLSFHRDTQPKWKDPKTGDLEGLAHEFNLCKVLNEWEQIRNSSVILTREFLEALPDGWHTYAWRRINKGDQLNKCENVTRCMEKLALVLPEVPPFKPRQYGRCAVVGNSGDLLVTKFGKDIDSHDAVIRNNGAPTQGFSVHVGEKSTFRLLNRGSAKALDKVVELTGNENEVLIIKSTIHDVMSKLIQEVPIRNPVYLLLGVQFGAAAKGTGLKALEFALSVCESVDMYGFSVDPGYTNWTRYFSESRGGHAPLQARAYYHVMECLGLVKIHSPLREQRGHEVTEVPERRLLNDVRRTSIASINKLSRESIDPSGSCSIWATRASKASSDEHTAKLWRTSLRHDHLLGGISMYPLPQSPRNRMLCVRPTDSRMSTNHTAGGKRTTAKGQEYAR